jgi:DNA-binding transcriptional regulator YiaG
MWLADAVVNSALVTTLFLGVPQTPSSHLRSVGDVYHGGQRTISRPAPQEVELRDSEPSTIEHLGGWHTDDTGAKLDLGRLPISHKTGRSLRLYRAKALLQHRWTDGHPTAIAQWPTDLPHKWALQWIKEATGLSDQRIGKLLGVSRESVCNWNDGLSIKEVHRRHLLETKDILQRAARMHPGRDGLITWLNTPDEEEGMSPARLLEQGHFDRARLLAVLSPTTVMPTPEWAKHSVPAVWRDALEQPERPGEFTDEFL